MEVSRSYYSSLSEGPGVYIFVNNEGEVLYVGKAKNVKKRVSSYFSTKDLGPKTSALVSRIDKIRTLKADSEIESFLLEANLIKKYNPRYNSRLTDGKSYPYIRITVKDPSPKILFVRKTEDKKSVYFGPYPNAGDLKTVLKLIRKIFPYQSVLNHQKRFCLYNSLGLCPCPPMFKNQEEVIKYKRYIKHIRQFLSGETKKVIRELENERDVYSKKEKFEEALSTQKKIDSVKLITSPRNSPFDYELNPNLTADLRNAELLELKKYLVQNGVPVRSLERIECYDISNLSGKNATASMVVFTNGDRNPPEYRRFKIKNPPKVVPNDFAMLTETLRRRFNHPEWESPGLIIVDGGKGQVSSVLKSLKEKNINIPVIGIAKREEVIITEDFTQIRLPRNSIALNLVRRIRDEAHRFALAYHKKLRSKLMFPKI